MATTPFHRARPRSNSSLRAEALLDRYPDLSDSELVELTALFPRLNMVERGLIAADDRLGGRVEHFYRDHGERLSGFSAQTAALVSALAVAAMMFWIVLG